MAGLKEINYKLSYHKGSDDIANEFYLPSMERARTYDRAVGFFSSTIYILAWPSLKIFVNNGGKIRVICSPVLSPDDVNAIDEGYMAKVEQSYYDSLVAEVHSLLDKPYLNKPTQVLASLIALGVIEIKIAFMHSNASPKHKRLFHDKVGVFTDEIGDTVAFKGSMNETWVGLSKDGNLESVDVFLSWEGERDRGRVLEEVSYFDNLWNNKYPNVSVLEFPEIAKEKLINACDLRKWPELVDEICSDIDAIANISADRKPGGRTPLPHQVSALQEWNNHNRKGILEHATGSGKTFTALCAIRDAFSRNEVPLILVPSRILFDQWLKEIQTTFSDLDLRILKCGNGHLKWKETNLLRSWTSPGLQKRIVIAMMQTAAKTSFLDNVCDGQHLFLVADEVHRMGSREHQRIFSLETGPKLGLSATPRRAGDPVGTEAILSYFDGIIPPPFTLKDAIKSGTLTPYMYFVHQIHLSKEEQASWEEVTLQVKRMYAKLSSQGHQANDSKQFKQLLIKRSKIVKAAVNKVSLALQVIQDHYHIGQKWIIYCDSQTQLNSVLCSLRDKGYSAMEYHSAMQGDKEQTLNYFNGIGGIIVSIRCLDEGVDIPSVTHALILASSKNPREFIQRRGRVLRKSDYKSLAFIHDAIVVPWMNEKEYSGGVSILEGELARAIEFGEYAANPSSVIEIKRIAVRYGLDYEKLRTEGYEEDE